MSLKSKVTNAVDKAFTAVGDLAEFVLLSQKTAGAYDFNTGTASSTSVDTSVLAIVIAVKQKPDEAELLAPRKEVYIKEKDLKDPALYDTITIGTVSHTIIQVTHEPGLITLLITEG